MKNWKRVAAFIGIFVAGTVVGIVYSHFNRPTNPLEWSENEEQTLARMLKFQQQLDKLWELEGPNDVETLSKHIDAQQGIEQVILRYRDSVWAKWNPLIPSGGTIIAAAVAGFLAWHVSRRSRPDSKDGSAQS